MSNAIERWLENKKLTPFRDFSQMQESFDRLFNEVMNLRRSNGLQDYNFAPSCEVFEEGSNYILKFDLPGVTKEQIKVEAEKDYLTVRAERKEEKKREDKKKFLSEIYYGSYSRTFNLPGITDDKMIDAKFENGVLTVIVPKSDTQKVKQIPIH